MKVYIAGKVGNLPFDQVKEKFRKAAELLRSQGYEVVSPIEQDHSKNSNWCEYMLTDLTALYDCDAICMLPDWYRSPGAIVEYMFSRDLGKEVYRLTKENKFVIF